MRIEFSILIWASYIVCFAASVEEDSQCEVRTRIDSGWICGTRRQAENNVQYVSFRGIPYAEQPLGELRFKELQPVKPWSDHLMATEEGPVCPQQVVVYEKMVQQRGGISEACIHANVHVPLEHFNPEYSVDDGDHHESKKGIPILVFIHGGGLFIGSGDSDLHGPEYLVSKGVIVITFNYRLNVFGFLSLNTPKIPGNNGLRDQITLLRWVQRNARAFGGDPTDVTLGGQSAGASSAHLLMLSPAAQGLFKRVIMMSGTAIPSYFITSPIYAEMAASRFLTLLGVNSTDPDEIHDILVKAPLEDILKANTQYQDETGLTTFCPTVEDVHPGVTRIIDGEPLNLIKSGRGKEYPMMIGFTSAECQIFKNRFMSIDMLKNVENTPPLTLPLNLIFSTSPYLTIDLAEKVIDRYTHGEKLTLEEYIEVCSDVFFVHPAFKVAEWRANMEGAAPVYLYQFSYEAEFSVLKTALNIQFSGAAHLEDQNFVFRENAILGEVGTFTQPSQDIKMTDWMTQFVVNFIRWDKPTPDDSWHAVNKEFTNYQDIKKPAVNINTMPTKEQIETIELFDSIYESAGDEE